MKITLSLQLKEEIVEHIILDNDVVDDLEVMILNANLAMNVNKGPICIKSLNVFPS
jgi:hypothetical protein